MQALTGLHSNQSTALIDLDCDLNGKAIREANVARRGSDVDLELARGDFPRLLGDIPGGMSGSESAPGSYFVASRPAYQIDSPFLLILTDTVDEAPFLSQVRSKPAVFRVSSRRW
jgi:hypothetical protein